MKITTYRYLLLLILASVLKTLSSLTRAAIVHQDVPAKLTGALLRQDISELSQPETANQSLLTGFKKFLLLTTGKQVKLYPLNDDNRPSEKYFLVKILDERFRRERYADVRKNRTAQDMRSGSEGKSILPRRALDSKGLAASTRTSILPKDDPISGDDEFIDSDSGRLDFWISDINYFFDASRCTSSSEYATPKPEECMVIVYLDAKRQKIGFAAIDLRRVPTDAKYSRQTLWASIIQSPFATDLELSLEVESLDTTEIAVDRNRRLVYMNLQGQFQEHIFRLNLSENAINRHPDDLVTCVANERLRNLNIDDSNGDWLFYSGNNLVQPKVMQTIVGAVDLGPHPNRNHERMTALIADDTLENPQRFGVSGSAPDPESRQMFWLTEQNELKARNFDGGNLRVIKELPARPLIKEPGRTEIVQGSFYVSDSKRRLFHLELPYQSNYVGSLQLLLIEDRLENFRIGSLPAYIDNRNRESINGRESYVLAMLPCFPSLQDLSKDILEEYTNLDALAGDDSSCLSFFHLRLFDMMPMLVTLIICVLIIYLKKTRNQGAKLMDEKPLKKGALPV